MKEDAKKVILMSLGVLMLIIIITSGTYAFFYSSARDGGNDIGGKTVNFDVNASLETIKTGNLIPIRDNLIPNALSAGSICVDSRGYDACALYKVTLTNTSDAQTLIGYITLNNSTTISTNDFKYQLMIYSGGSYTAISDSATISSNRNVKNYFVSSGSNVEISLLSGLSSATSSDYYILVWLSDDNTDQSSDTQSKVLSGAVTFESLNGGETKAEF